MIFNINKKKTLIHFFFFYRLGLTRGEDNRASSFSLDFFAIRFRHRRGLEITTSFTEKTTQGG